MCLQFRFIVPLPLWHILNNFKILKSPFFTFVGEILNFLEMCTIEVGEKKMPNNISLLCPNFQISNGSPEIPKVETLATLGLCSFVCRPPIEMRSKKKL